MKKGILLVAAFVSTTLVVGMTLAAISSQQVGGAWLFPDLGPAVIQDTQYGRAPILESPFSPFGDIPGGYSPYWGNLLVDELLIESWECIELQGLEPRAPTPDTSTMLLGLLITILPLTVVSLAGRRSYGASKTR